MAPKLYGIRTRCPHVAIAYAAKGNLDGDDAFIRPFESMIDTKEGIEFMNSINYYRTLMRRTSCYENVTMKNNGSKWNRKVSFAKMKKLKNNLNSN